MAQQYAYNYAIIDETGMCVEVQTTTRDCTGYDGYIAIPEYNEEYIMKYYNTADGKWYEDAEFTIEWIPE